MKRIRIGKDISMRWEITTDGVAIPLEGRDLTIEIKSPAGIENNIPYRVEGNILIMTYYGYEQKRPGEYSITLWEKKGKPGQNVVDVIRAFELVRTSQEENDFVGGDLQIESVDLGTENFDILTEGGYRAINIDTLQADALKDSVNIKGKTYSNESFTITLPKANLDSAGVMSADDKKALQDHGNSISQLESTTSGHSNAISQINTTLEEHNERINAKITTDRIEDGAVTSEKIATSAFDDTLSVSGKIAPADIVGSKLTELESEIGTLMGITVNETVILDKEIEGGRVDTTQYNYENYPADTIVKVSYTDIPVGSSLSLAFGFYNGNAHYFFGGPGGATTNVESSSWEEEFKIPSPLTSITIYCSNTGFNYNVRIAAVSKTNKINKLESDVAVVVTDVEELSADYALTKEKTQILDNMMDYITVDLSGSVIDTQSIVPFIKAGVTMMASLSTAGLGAGWETQLVRLKGEYVFSRVNSYSYPAVVTFNNVEDFAENGAVASVLMGSNESDKECIFAKLTYVGIVHRVGSQAKEIVEIKSKGFNPDKGLIQKIVGDNVNVVEHNNYILVETDKNGKVIHAVTIDGTHCFSKISSPVIDDIQDMINDNINKKLVFIGDSTCQDLQSYFANMIDVNEEVYQGAVGAENVLASAARQGGIPAIVMPFTIPTSSVEHTITDDVGTDPEIQVTANFLYKRTYDKDGLLVTPEIQENSGLMFVKTVPFNCIINGVKGYIYSIGGYETDDEGNLITSPLSGKTFFHRYGSGDEVVVEHPTEAIPYITKLCRDNFNVNLMGTNHGFDFDANYNVVLDADKNSEYYTSNAAQRAKNLFEIQKKMYQYTEGKYLIVGFFCPSIPYDFSKEFYEEYETLCEKEFGQKFFNARLFLKDEAWKNQNITLTARDRSNISQGMPPASLFDNDASPHLNALGNTELVKAVALRMYELGWLKKYPKLK